MESIEKIITDMFEEYQNYKNKDLSFNQIEKKEDFLTAPLFLFNNKEFRETKNYIIKDIKTDYSNFKTAKNVFKFIDKATDEEIFVLWEGKVILEIDNYGEIEHYETIWKPMVIAKEKYEDYIPA